MSRKCLRYVSSGAYPVLVGAALTGYAVLLAAGTDVVLATVVPLLATAAAITLLETRLTYRRDWCPRPREVGTDLCFMAIVQGLLPELLAFVLVAAVAESAGTSAPPFATLWPHDWHPAAQAVVLLLGVDFISYWVHRAMHRTPALWRLHAVHHSVEHLYWLNVGRFHPVEKSLQFLASTAPFLLLGVSPVVFGAYFVFYALNGFVQHSNIRLRFGPLNWLISSPELHRWHHSVDASESDHNFGNSLIIWDVLFGTRFLPRDRRVGPLGIRMDYPHSFPGLMAAPFRGLSAVAARWAIGVAMKAIELTHLHSLNRATCDPAAEQWKTLSRILRSNAGSRFGSGHSFSRIDSVAAFRAAVPTGDYSAIQPYIDEQRRTGIPALTEERPRRYLHTSGTSGAPKLIPVLGSSERRWAAHQRLLVRAQFRKCPEAFDGKLLAIVSPAVEKRLEDGTAVGAMSGALYERLSPLVRRRAVLPPGVAGIPDYALRYRTILRLAVVERDITLLASPNPSTFLRLLELYEEERDALIRSVADGEWRGLNSLEPHARRAVSGLLHADPARAAELRDLGPSPGLGDLWPRLRMVSTWTGGSCGIALEALRRRLPRDTEIFELGYVASELRGTLPVDGHCDGVPDLQHVFYEFAERQAWDRGDRDTIGLEGLRRGHDYYLIVTTPDGLYRYFMNDLLRVTGFHNRTPRLRFLQKGRGVTNITGEKVSEAQVLEAMREVEQHFGIAFRFFMMLADEHAARYRLMVEPSGEAFGFEAASLAAQVDSLLCRLNMEYAAKRESGRLNTLQAAWLRPGAGEAYKEHSLEKGQRETQFKPEVLQYARACSFNLEEHAARPCGTGKAA